MAQYVDIMTDAGFKAVFQDKQVTIKFLNAALAGERQIKDITYLDKEIKVTEAPAIASGWTDRS